MTHSSSKVNNGFINSNHIISKNVKLVFEIVQNLQKYHNKESSLNDYNYP